MLRGRQFIASDRFAMAEACSLEREIGKFALACATVVQILEADGITKAHDVHDHVAHKQHSPRMPKKRDLSSAMSGSVNNFDAAGDGQHVTGGKGLIDGDRLHSLLGIEEQP
jgi:hypothetical protein